MITEVQRAEAIDWWEGERSKIASELEERLPLLLIKIDTEIDKMPLKSLFRRGKFRTEKIEPIVVRWLEVEYARFTAELDKSYLESRSHVEGFVETDSWSYSEIATVGAAAAFSVAPLAAIPFVGGLVVGGTTILGITFGGVAVLAMPAVALGLGAVALGAGPGVRDKARARLRNKFKDSVHRELAVRVTGDPNRPEIASLKGTLFMELDQLLALRIGGNHGA